MIMNNPNDICKIFLALSTCLIALLCVSCSDSSTSSTAEAKNCVEPENPYVEDTGHYAGYNQAQENGETCDGNSESFDEGCNEYYNQLDTYEACVKRQ
jgi:hypothetical protein